MVDEIVEIHLSIVSLVSNAVFNKVGCTHVLALESVELVSLDGLGDTIDTLGVVESWVDSGIQATGLEESFEQILCGVSVD